MATTPVFGWPYQSLTDPPNGATLGRDLALAIEATASGLDARLDVLEPINTRMGCSLRRVAAQNLPDSTFTDVSWDTEDADTNGLFPGAGSTITIPAGGGGLWAITTTVSTVASPTGLAFIQIGGLAYRTLFADNFCGISVTVPLNAGATFAVSVYMDSAAGTTMTGAVHAYRVAA